MPRRAVDIDESIRISDFVNLEVNIREAKMISPCAHETSMM